MPGVITDKNYLMHQLLELWNSSIRSLSNLETNLVRSIQMSSRQMIKIKHDGGRRQLTASNGDKSSWPSSPQGVRENGRLQASHLTLAQGRETTRSVVANQVSKAS